MRTLPFSIIVASTEAKAQLSEMRMRLDRASRLKKSGQAAIRFRGRCRIDKKLFFKYFSIYCLDLGKYYLRVISSWARKNQKFERKNAEKRRTRSDWDRGARLLIIRVFIDTYFQERIIGLRKIYKI